MGKAVKSETESEDILYWEFDNVNSNQNPTS
jgi:hypothetical protein